MTRPLEGRRVALAEGRQLEDLARMLEAEGAVALRYPLLAILDPPDPAPVRDWLDELIANRLALLILMTGEAVRRLTAAADRAGIREPFLTALRQTPNVTRGPKPVQALRELGLTAGRVAAVPTTEGIIASLQGVAMNGQSVGYTLYGQDNPTLDAHLRGAGAVPRPVLSYVYAPAADDDRVVELIGKLVMGGVDSLVITSTPQVERLFEVAKKQRLEEDLRRGLEGTQVAAIGPVAAEGLRARGVRVDVCPEQGFVMKNLVRQMGRAAPGETGA